MTIILPRVSNCLTRGYYRKESHTCIWNALKSIYYSAEGVKDHFLNDACRIEQYLNRINNANLGRLAFYFSLLFIYFVCKKTE